jgi:hypothetical protein
MAKYRIRYKYGNAPDGAENESTEIEAATFETAGNFIDFYSEATPANTMNVLLPRGKVVFRVAQDVVADIQRFEE